MLRFFIVLMYAISPFVYASAHDHDKAFFSFTTRGDSILIESEFPWALRNALLQYQPNLRQATSTYDFLDALKAYVEEKLQLITVNGQQLALLSVSAMDNQLGHSHGHTFQFVYARGDIAEIQNTIMFEANKTQQNFHTLLINGKQSAYTTTQGSPSIKIKRGASNAISYRYLLLLLLPVLFFLLLIFYRRRRRS